MSEIINEHVENGRYTKVITHGKDCSVLITTNLSGPLTLKNLLILNYEFFGKLKTFEIGLGDHELKVLHKALDLWVEERGLGDKQ